MIASMNDNAALYEQVLTYSKSIGPYQSLTLPWWVKTPARTYPPRHRCHVETLNCGERVFARIADDIRAARRSVDIITWGFDPGMAIIRDANGNGLRYGDLLIEAATRKSDPVTVRLLLWHDDALSQAKMKNIPGLYGVRLSAVGCMLTSYYCESHEKYNAEWFDDIRKGKYPNIQVQVRAVPSQLLKKSMEGEGAPGNWAAALAQVYPSHHQKMLMVDYEIPAKAVGYVMGHNSVTDYWDTPDHPFRSPRRETLYSKDPSSIAEIGVLDRIWSEASAYGQYPSGPSLEERKAAAVEAFTRRYGFTAKPYQDVSTRLRGPILYDLNHNFCQGWRESMKPQGFFFDVTAPLRAILKHAPRGLPGTVIDIPRPGAQQDSSHDFIAARSAIKADRFLDRSGKHSVQLLRTQPMHGEKTIKECYANMTRQMRHYIFLQNQYVQYPGWADHLNECINRLRKKGFAAPIYVFILTSTPETDGMDLLAYDVVKRLGQSETMVIEHNEALEESKRQKTSKPWTPEQFSNAGVNVVIGSLWTCAKSPIKADDFEEIYVHAKVAIVDDAAATVGSANLNIRSMAFDSELNILTDASDIVFSLRSELFNQAVGDSGPGKYQDMKQIHKRWIEQSQENLDRKDNGARLIGQLVSFRVDRKPGTPII